MPLEGVLGCLKAESGLDPLAARPPDIVRGVTPADYATYLRYFPDVSFGFGQITVSSARGHGYGNGTDSLANILYVREVMFDRRTSLMACCEHYRWNLDYVDAVMPGLTGDERLIMGLRVYNGGTYGLTAAYAQQYASNLAAYRGCLVWAHDLLGT